MLRVLDLFSGIGGFSLGLERTGGFTTVAFCEIDPFCRRVLATHWPEVRQYDDITTLTGARLAADGIVCDVLCGGFPCQDISSAGKGVGLAGARSGLWFEYARLIAEIRPRWVIIENVSALRARGLDRVLGALAALGYDAEWHCIPAAAVGAPHRRDRIWIVAHHDGAGCERARPPQPEGWQRDPVAARGGAVVGDAESGRCGARHVADAKFERCARHGGSQEPIRGATGAIAFGGEERSFDWWAVEPDVGRVAHGVPARVDRLRALGNAVVPQVVEALGRMILG